jgi:hypothetical protein
MRRLRLWLVLVAALALAGGVGHEAFAGGGSKPQTATKPALTASQKAARKKLLAQAEFLKKNKLNCGCRHHFPRLDS